MALQVLPREIAAVEAILAQPDTPDMNAIAAEFAQFSKLPLELRLEIWKQALPGPRIIEIEYCTLLEE
jgi:hypothetical protein